MSAVEILNFSELLEPIPGENPAGADLRPDFSPDSPYQKLKTAREDARRIENYRDDGKGDGSEPQWDPVCQLAPDLLRSKAKDIVIAVWLTEGLTRCQGLPGLRDGLHLMRELCEKFWPQLYPLPVEGEGFEARVQPIESMAATLPRIISVMPMTQGRTVGPFHLSDFNRALAIEQIVDPDKKAKRMAEGAATLTTIQKAADESAPEFFRALMADLEGCQKELAGLSVVLDQQCGVGSGPNLTLTAEALDGCVQMLQKIAASALAPTSAGGGEAGAANSTAGGGAFSAPSGSFQGREEAFATLLRIAQFFKETEPHTPVSYVLEQAVRWGRKPLPALWAELIGEETVRNNVFKLVGIPPQEPNPPGGT